MTSKRITPQTSCACRIDAAYGDAFQDFLKATVVQWSPESSRHAASLKRPLVTQIYSNFLLIRPARLFAVPRTALATNVEIDRPIADLIRDKSEASISVYGYNAIDAFVNDPVLRHRTILTAVQRYRSLVKHHPTAPDTELNADMVEGLLQDAFMSNGATLPGAFRASA